MLPVGGGEDYAEGGDGDFVAVYMVAAGGGIAGSSDAAGCGGWLEVRYDLVAEEIEVDPVVGAAAFGTAEDGAVEVAGSGEVVYGKGDVEGLQSHVLMILSGSGGGQRGVQRCPTKKQVAFGCCRCACCR